MKRSIRIIPDGPLLLQNLVTFVGDILHDLRNGAIQNTTQIIDGCGVERLVVTQLVDGRTGDAMVFDQCVGGFSGGMQGPPKRRIGDHGPHPLLVSISIIECTLYLDYAR